MSTRKRNKITKQEEQPQSASRLPSASESGHVVKSASEVTSPDTVQNLQPPKRTPKAREYAFRLRRWFIAADVVKTCAKYGAFVAMAWFATDCVKEIAGKKTVVEMVVDFASRVHMNQWAAWLAAGLLGLGWWRTHKSKQRLRKEVLPRVPQLESQLDPGRTSSGLDELGESPKGDMS